MKRSKYQIKKLSLLKEEAHFLYTRGFTLREVAAKIGKSRQWVWRVVQEKENVDN